LKLSDAEIKSDVKTMRIKDISTKVLNYDYVKEFKDFLQTEQEFGTCVIDNFIGMYGNKLKMSRALFIDLIRDYYSNNASPLDHGTTSDEWVESDGVCPKALQYICEKYDIGHYCYDVTNNCVMKHISKNRNYETLCYFCINDHMYLIKDPKMKKTMSEHAKDRSENVVKSTMFENTFDTKKIFMKN
jgi:hypothetical protein